MDSQVVDINCAYLGLDRLLLMENAGAKIAEKCIEYSSIAFFCGLGNNAGDGLVAARHLTGLGKKVRVYALEGIRSKQCQKNLDIMYKLDMSLQIIRDSTDCEKIADEIGGYAAVVDALIGVGIKGSLREPVKSIVRLINRAHAKKISVDLPTGDDENRVKADLIISLDTAKTEECVVVDIGIPAEARLYCGPGDVVSAIPPRSDDSHKGQYGRLLIVGGSIDYVGAPYLAASSAFNVGTDLVTLTCPAYVAQRIPYDPNLIVNPLNSKEYIESSDVDNILKKNFDTLLIGNGLGVCDETKDAVKEIVKEVEVPIIIDADALVLLNKKYLADNTLVTPHSREFERLFGEYDEDNRVKLAEGYASKTGTTVLLKGGVDVISDGKITRLNRSGNPSMTVGGTGDVLAGIAAGLSAQNKDIFTSACAAAFLTGLAGDLAYERLGVSLKATDVICEIPAAIRYCQGFI